MKKPIAIASIAIFICFLSQITLFIVQPIGAMPEGRTVVIWRLNKTQFIDSADAMCEREQGSVNLLCRMAMMTGVINNSSILARFPYSQTLYEISTNGNVYDR